MVTKNQSLRVTINGTIANFIQSPQGRDKRAVHSLGEFITFLSVTDSYSWKDIAAPYYLEHLDRFPYLSIYYYYSFFPPFYNLHNHRHVKWALKDYLFLKNPVQGAEAIQQQLETWQKAGEGIPPHTFLAFFSILILMSFFLSV